MQAGRNIKTDARHRKTGLAAIGNKEKGLDRHQSNDKQGNLRLALFAGKKDLG